MIHWWQAFYLPDRGGPLSLCQSWLSPAFLPVADSRGLRAESDCETVSSVATGYSWRPACYSKKQHRSNECHYDLQTMLSTKMSEMPFLE